MITIEPTYSARIAYPDCLVRGRSQTVRLELYRSGALAAPTEAGSTFALYGASGETLITASPITLTARCWQAARSRCTAR